MYILSVETTGNSGSVALISTDGKYIGSKISNDEMSNLRLLAPMTDELLKESGVFLDEIACCAACVGPGSFTGIRIGVNFARTLAQALKIKCISVSSLEIFREFCGDSKVCVILNARRMQVYAAVYDEDGNALVTPGAYMLDEILEKTESLGNVKFYGDGVDAYSDTLDKYFDSVNKNQGIADRKFRYQNAELVAMTAIKKFREGKTVDVNGLKPDYMRIAEAEQKLRDGTLKKRREEKLKRLLGR